MGECMVDRMYYYERLYMHRTSYSNVQASAPKTTGMCLGISV